MAPRSPYKSPAYQRARAVLAAGVVACWESGCGQRASIPDHQPPLSLHRHLEGSGCCELRPQCLRHSLVQGARLATGRSPQAPEPGPGPPEPEGFGADHPVWQVDWLEELLEVPANASWPRLMTPVHPDAVGSYGAEFAASAAERSGMQLRWWQRLAAARLLEHDGDGRLVWGVALLSTARQVGKSVLLRELLAWRLLQGERFGEPQTLLHVSKDVAVGRWIQKAARAWAKQYPDDFRVREANGAESIEYRDGSVWLLKSRTGVYGFSASMAVVDEAWKVSAEAVEEGLVPTLVERASAQLVLSSTAHAGATSLMLDRRNEALAALYAPGQGDLLIEWSAPPDGPLEDERTWRMASPHWTPQREAMVRAALERALSASGPVGSDPRVGFDSQWRNRWPAELMAATGGNPLLAPGLWEGLQVAEHGVGPLVIGVEDWYGAGAACAAVRALADGRLIVAAWEFDRREEAAAYAAELADLAPRPRLVVGAGMAADPWVAELAVVRVDSATSTQTRTGLATFRDLAREGRLVWDEADGSLLGERIAAARVRQLASGLALVEGGRQDALRAAIWAVAVAARKSPAVPAIY